MRKGFLSCTEADSLTHVFDEVSAFIPDQSLGLREMMMQFAYIGSDKLEEIVNRGYIGDEDDENSGLVVGALDFAEIHDRLVNDFAQVSVPARLPNAPITEDEPAEDEPADADDADANAQRALNT